MLDRAQEAVGPVELVACRGGDPAALMKALQRHQSLRAAQLPLAAACDQLLGAKNSISRMPPRPSLMLWPATAIVAKPWKAWIWRFIA